MSSGSFKPTKSQQQAIDRLDGRLFIAAGAGSGKTEVVANRFVEAIAQGKAEVDQILTITFTKKAAAEMMKRVRKVLRQRMTGDPDPERAERMSRAYCNIESARISTNDSFYSRVLLANALAAGIDPEFTVTDETRAQLMREEAFEEALHDFVERNGAAGTDFVLAYDPRLQGNLFNIVDDIYKTIRSRGQKPRLPVPDPEEFFSQSCRRLLAAIDDFDEAVARTGAAYATIGKIQETNWKLKAAVIAPQMEAKEQQLIEGEPKGARGELSQEIKQLIEAWKNCMNALRSIKAVGTVKLMGELLESYDRVYKENKHNNGVMDFADLALCTRDLLVENDSVRQRLSSSFKMVMVDEYQDTNPLQAEITDLIISDLRSGNLMMVGDENQSIFGFRDAEVDLFRNEDEQAREGDYRIPLVENFRSQAEILAFVDAIFQDSEREGNGEQAEAGKHAAVGEQAEAGKHAAIAEQQQMLGRSYLKLKAMAEKDPQPETCRIELLMVDTNPADREKPLSASDARKVEAQLIAERLLELNEEGYGFGEMAILMAARTGVEIYRDALDRANIKNYLAIGISFYDQLELGDSINMYRLIVNPLDDEALVAALRSPLVGVSDDTLYWLRQAAGLDREGNPEPLWTVIGSGAELGDIAVPDRGRLSRFATDLEELRDFAARNSLQATARRVVSYNDFMATTAAGYRGKQALANLMKGLDLAAEFEAAWGRDLVAFTEFLVNQKSSEVREADAPIEEEGVDSVRLMTMHSSKGLEFPLVVLPKLGAIKGQKNSRPTVLVDRDEDSGRIGLIHTEPGLDKITVFDYEELLAEKAARELEEEKRLIYVAMTRAERHLVLVGYTGLEKPGKGMGEGSRPLDWIRARFSLDRESRPGLDELEQFDDVAGAPVRLQVCTDPDKILAQAEESEAVHELAEAPEPVSAAIREMPAPAVYVPSLISPTGLDMFNACPRRYFFDRVLKIEGLLDVKMASRPAVEGGSLNAMDMGSLVHYLLEHDLEIAFDGSVTPAQMDAAAAPNILTEADHTRASDLLASFARAPVARTLLAAHKEGRLQKEFSFSTLIGQTIVQGTIDALCPHAEGGTLVVDYKTGRIAEGKTLEEAAATYRYQMASYALAAARLNPVPVRVVLVFLGGDEPVESVMEYTQAESGGLEDEISEVIDSMATGDFPPLNEFDGHQCHWCAAGPNGAHICMPGC